MSLKLDDNQLTSLPLQWDSLKLIRHLSASANKIAELPDEIGLLRQMEFLNLEDNAIEEIPFGMAELSEKKFKEINFKGNPLSDPRCKRILEREKLPVKPLLAHLKKMAKQGGGKKKKKQQEAAEEPEPAAPSLSVSDMEQRITFVYEQKNQDKVSRTLPSVPLCTIKSVLGCEAPHSPHTHTVRERESHHLSPLVTTCPTRWTMSPS